MEHILRSHWLCSTSQACQLFARDKAFDEGWEL